MHTSRPNNWFDLVSSFASKPVACLLLLFVIQWSGLQLHTFTHSTGPHSVDSLGVCSFAEVISETTTASHCQGDILPLQIDSESWLAEPESDQPASSLTSQCPLCMLALELHNLGPPASSIFLVEILPDVQLGTVSRSIYSYLLSSLQSSRAPPVFTLG